MTFNKVSRRETLDNHIRFVKNGRQTGEACSIRSILRLLADKSVIKHLHQIKKAGKTTETIDICRSIALLFLQ